MLSTWKGGGQYYLRETSSEAGQEKSKEEGNDQERERRVHHGVTLSGPPEQGRLKGHRTIERLKINSKERKDGDSKGEVVERKTGKRNLYLRAKALH